MAASLTLLPALVLSLQPQDSADAPPAGEVAPRPAEQAPPPVDNESIEGRRRPGYEGPLPDAVTQDNPGAVRRAGDEQHRREHRGRGNGDEPSAEDPVQPSLPPCGQV